MDQQTAQNNGFPEAPASASMKIKSPLGAEYIFTMRDEKASTLFFKMKAMEEKFLKEGYTFVSQGKDSGRSSNGFSQPKTDQVTCKHVNITTKQSSGHNKPENKGRYYDSCLDCNKWIGWKEQAEPTPAYPDF